MQLRTTIFLRTTGLIVLLIGAVSGGLSLYAVRDQRRSEEQQVTSTAIFLADQAAGLVTAGKPTELTALLKSMVRNHSAFVYAFVERDAETYADTFDGAVPHGLLSLLDVAPDRPMVIRFEDDTGRLVYNAAAAVGDTDAILHVGMPVPELAPETTGRITTVAPRANSF